MVRRLLNRLTGRTDSSDNAVNAYVEGNASPDEIRLVEEMMRQDSSLEKNLSTQQALKAVLGRIEKPEAPRSFAITPEMVAAAEDSQSGLSRLAAMFGPQQRLALAPAVIAGIAALSVALLTLGDISGVVDQSEARRNESFSSAAVAESGASGGGSLASSPGNPGNPGAAGSPGGSDSQFDMDDSVALLEKAVQPADSSSGSAPAATAAPAATVEVMAADDQPALGVAMATPAAATSAGAATSETAEQPPSLAAEAPTAGEAAEPPSTTQMIAPELAEEIDSADGAEAISGDRAAMTDSDAEFAYAEEAVLAPSSTNDGISLPLWQLQVALAALAVAAIGAWAGLRRINDE